jgi:hypothetical protein
MIKNGTRLQSQVCDTQVIVVRSPDSLDDLRAGGVAMVSLDQEMPAKDSGATIDPAFPEGNLMGKRYVDDGGAEVLVAKGRRGLTGEWAQLRRNAEDQVDSRSISVATPALLGS